MIKLRALILRLAVRVILWADGWERLGKGNVNHLKWVKSSNDGKTVLIGDWRYAVTQFVNRQAPSDEMYAFAPKVTKFVKTHVKSKPL